MENQKYNTIEKLMEEEERKDWGQLKIMLAITALLAANVVIMYNRNYHKLKQVEKELEPTTISANNISGGYEDINKNGKYESVVKYKGKPVAYIEKTKEGNLEVKAIKHDTGK